MKSSTQFALKGALIIILCLYTLTGYSQSVGGEGEINISDGLKNFGKVLVGAAKIEPNGVQWVGTYSPNLLAANFTPPSFGFTGEHRYNDESAEAGTWRMLTSSLGYSTSSPKRKTQAAGIYFAPKSAGEQVSTLSLSWGSLPVMELVRGEGVDAEQGALTLDVKHQIDNSKVTFTVTPKVDVNKVPSDTVADYLLVILNVTNVNTGCSTGKTLFQDSFAEGTDFRYDIDNYFDYLNHLAPEKSSVTCSPSHLFLVSKDDPFGFTATKLPTPSPQSTGENGYVEYKFYIFGHEKDSKTFQLRREGVDSPVTVTADGQTVEIPPLTDVGQPAEEEPTTSSPAPPVADFTATPKQGEAPLIVSLDASGSTGNIKQYSWQINPALSATPIGIKPTVTFPTAGVYTVSLKVIDNSGNSSTSPEQQIIVESPPIDVNAALTADFVIETATLEEIIGNEDKSPFSLTLKATYPNADSYQWSISKITAKETEVNQSSFELEGKTTTFSVSEPGDYLIVLQVKNATQPAVPSSKIITLPLLLAEFTAFPQAGDPGSTGLQVALDASKTQDYLDRLAKKQGIDISKIHWQWWKGNTPIENDSFPKMQITLTGKREYPITLVGMTSEGQHVSASRIIYVGDYQPPTAVLEIPTLSTEGVKMDASKSTVTSSSDNPNPRLTDYQWTIKEFFLIEEGTKDTEGHFISSGEKPILEERQSTVHDQHGYAVSIPLEESASSLVEGREQTWFKETTYQQIILQVTDNVGLTNSTGTGFMQFSQGTSADQNGILSGSDATFLGSVGKYTFHPQEPIYINVDVNVAPRDLNQTAEVLAVILTPDNQFRFRMKVGQIFKIWENAPNELANLEAIGEPSALGNPLNIPVLSGTLAEHGLDPRLGTYSVWVGYRLEEEGTVIFNSSPITFVVQ